jgi:ankyrin repeat protein
MKTKLPCLVVVLACALAGPAPAAESAAARLQQGLFEEEANQHYDAAIAAYQSVLATHEEERRLAATALFRLGECYRKLGRTNEAVSHYQRLLHDFSDQGALTRLSEQHLAAMGMPRDITLAFGRVAEEYREVCDRVAQLTRQRAELSLTFTPENPRMQTNQIQLTQAQTRKLELETRYPSLLRASSTEEGQSTFRQRLLEITERAAGTGEKHEIERLQALLQESPDLVNTSKQGEPPPLHKAVQSGALEVADFLLNHGADIDLRAPSTWPSTDISSPLLLAAGQGNKAMTELLLKHHPRVDIRNNFDETPLIVAAASGFKAIVELLLAQGADPSLMDHNRKSALHRAIASNRREVVEVLLSKNPKLSAPASGAFTPLHEAVFAHAPNIAGMLLEKGAAEDDGRSEGQTPLTTAVLLNDETITALLLKHRANPNVRFRSDGLKMPSVSGSSIETPSVQVAGFTPLLVAAYFGRTPLVDRLLKAGAELNAQDASGATALNYAALLSRTETVRALLDAGADPNLAGRTSTPLGAATRAGGADVIGLLLEHKADPNQPEPGFTLPLLSAVGKGDVKAIQLLLDHGADVNAVGATGQTALDAAKGPAGSGIPRRGFGRSTPGDSLGGAELISLLRERGANEYAPHAGAITLCRVSRGTTLTAFLQGTNDFNQHTLVEALLPAYANDDPMATASSFAFPDLAKVRVGRRDPKTRKVEEINIDLAAILSSGDPAGDIPLQWGDVIEIPETDHRAQERWTGLTTAELAGIGKILTRTVQLVVKGETHPVTIVPVGVPTPGMFGGVPGPPAFLATAVSPAATPPDPRLFGVEQTKLSPPGQPRLERRYGWSAFRLRPILDGANVLRVSSDLSRVRVKRTDPVNGKRREWTLDYSSPGPQPLSDFWLRNGDVVEVPDK